MSDLGQAKKVTIDKDNTTIVEGKGSATDIQGRVKEIRSQVEKTASDYDREKLQERLAKLVGGVAIIKVGAATETEMKEKKARVEDAMHATRAAVEEGVVPGGGVALVRCSPAIDALKLEGDEKIGANIVRRALEEPLRQIVGNAGEEGAIVVGRIRDSKEANFGYNAQTGKFEDLVKAGVIDPTKVARTALQNAGSIAGMMLTTEALVSEIDPVLGPSVSYTNPKSRPSTQSEPSARYQSAYIEEDYKKAPAGSEAYVEVEMKNLGEDSRLIMGQSYVASVRLTKLDGVGVREAFEHAHGELTIQITASGDGLDLVAPNPESTSWYRSFMVDQGLDIAPAEFLFKPVRTGSCNLIVNLYCQHVWFGESRTDLQVQLEAEVGEYRPTQLNDERGIV